MFSVNICTSIVIMWHIPYLTFYFIFNMSLKGIFKNISVLIFNQKLINDVNGLFINF